MIAPPESRPEAISYITCSEFANRVRQIAFPEMVGERVRFSHDVFMRNALLKAQKYIDCLRNIQISLFDQEQMTVHCGVSRLKSPRGKINAVYAFTMDELCVKHFYDHTTPETVSCWISENRCCWQHPDTTEMKSGDEVCKDIERELLNCFRRGRRIFAVDREGLMYLAPRVPCDYLLLVHWEGVRRHWERNDVIPDDQDLIDWVALQTLADVTLRNDRNTDRHGPLRQKAREKFADLMYWCNEERRIQMRRECAVGLDSGNLRDMFQPIYELPCDPTPEIEPTPEPPPAPEPPEEFEGFDPIEAEIEDGEVFDGFEPIETEIEDGEEWEGFDEIEAEIEDGQEVEGVVLEVPLLVYSGTGGGLAWRNIHMDSMGVSSPWLRLQEVMSDEAMDRMLYYIREVMDASYPPMTPPGRVSGRYWTYLLSTSVLPPEAEFVAIRGIRLVAGSGLDLVNWGSLEDLGEEFPPFINDLYSIEESDENILSSGSGYSPLVLVEYTIP